MASEIGCYAERRGQRFFRFTFVLVARGRRGHRFMSDPGWGEVRRRESGGNGVSQ